MVKSVFHSFQNPPPEARIRCVNDLQNQLLQIGTEQAVYGEFIAPIIQCLDDQLPLIVVDFDFITHEKSPPSLDGFIITKEGIAVECAKRM